MAVHCEDIVKTSNNNLDTLLLDTCLSKFRSGYILAGKNKNCLPKRYEEFQKDITELKIRNDDVFVSSFPKNGTTWTQEMVWLLANDLNYEGAKQLLPERFPFLDVSMIYGEGEWTKYFPDQMTKSVEMIDKQTNRRFIKTHLPWELLPQEIDIGIKKPKIIYVWRNPKDCLISYYHHSILLEGYTGTFDEFFKLFIGGRVSFAPFWPHILGYWEKRHQSNILFLKFEDMKADLPAVINKVSAFLGISYTPDQVAGLADHLSFENMKNNKAVNYEPVTEMNKKYGLIKADGQFMRAGKVGEYKGVMSKEQIAEMDRWTKECLKGTGFEM